MGDEPMDGDSMDMSDETGDDTINLGVAGVVKLTQSTTTLLLANTAIQLSTTASPTALSGEAGAFELGVRLWRIPGAGWWRDYTVSGALASSSSPFASVALIVISYEYPIHSPSKLGASTGGRSIPNENVAVDPGSTVVVVPAALSSSSS